MYQKELVGEKVLAEVVLENSTDGFEFTLPCNQQSEYDSASDVTTKRKKRTRRIHC